MLSGTAHDRVCILYEYLPMSGRLRSYYEALALRLPHSTDSQGAKRYIPNLISEGERQGPWMSCGKYLKGSMLIWGIDNYRYCGRLKQLKRSRL